MKKLLLTVLTATMLFSCGGSSEKKGSENIDSKAEAGALIAYTNGVIDDLNDSGSWLRSNEKNIEKLTAAVKAKKKPLVPIFISPNIGSFKKKNATVAPSIMSEEEQKFFSETMEKYSNYFSALKTNVSELNKYLKNEDYKDNENKKGLAMIDSIEIYYNYLIETKPVLFDKIDIVTEKAEKIILADHPLKDPIFAMKGELQGFDDLYDAFYAYSEGEFTPEEVESAYNTLADNVEKNKGAFADILKENNKNSAYDRFYKTCEDGLAPFRKALRDVKDKKKVNERTFENFSSEINSIVKSYNGFVN